MAEPIRPKNETNLGGVKFDTNFAQNYGEYKVPHQNAGDFFIDFKNGTKVEYSQQPTDFSGGIFNSRQPGEIMHFEDSDKFMIFNNIDNLKITTTKTRDGMLYDIDNCNNLKMNVQSLTFSDIVIDNSNNVSVESSSELGYTSVRNCDQIDIKTGNKHDHIYATQSNNVNINSDSGDDYITINNCNNLNIDSGKGEDHVTINIEDEAVFDSRDVILPQGTIKMDNENDTLTISKKGDYIYDINFTYNEETDEPVYVHEHSVQSESVAKVKGVGTHNLSQTPDNAFRTTITTRIDQGPYLGEESVTLIKEDVTNE